MPSIIQVRELIRWTLHDLGASNTDAPQETLLIRGGRDCGRRFNCDGFQAVWFVEENQVKFYDQRGAVVRVCRTIPEFIHRPTTKSPAAQVA